MIASAKAAGSIEGAVVVIMISLGPKIEVGIIVVVCRAWRAWRIGSLGVALSSVEVGSFAEVGPPPLFTRARAPVDFWVFEYAN